VVDFTGIAQASDFTMLVEGTNVNTEFPGEEVPGTTIYLNAGDYSVTEDMGEWAGMFSSTYSESCSGSIDIGETKTCTITNYRMSAVTDSALCYFDRDPDTTEREFRLLFTPDLQNFPAYKLTASNPGQFYYNVFYVGEGGTDPVTIGMTVPYPFVTQGAMALHAYGSVEVSTNDAGQICFDPGDDHGVLPGEITLESYDNGTATVSYTFEGGVPKGQLVYVNLHLDYGLKGPGIDADGDGIPDRYEIAMNPDGTQDAVNYYDQGVILIPDRNPYTFSASINGVPYGEGGADTIINFNEFKKIPGVAGFVYDSVGELLEGATVVLHIPPQYAKFTGGVLVLTTTTDGDGWYMIEYKHKGKPSDAYWMKVFDPGDTSIYTNPSVFFKGNSFTEVHFGEP
jgi:hypothetical protein